MAWCSVKAQGQLYLFFKAVHNVTSERFAPCFTAAYMVLADDYCLEVNLWILVSIPCEESSI